jgi:hypothetical protein
MRLLNGSKLRVPFEGFQQFHCLLIHNMANGLPINLLQRPGRDQRSRVDFPKNLLPGMWGRTRAADGVLLRSGSRARPRGRLRHMPRPLKEYRFDQDGIGRAPMPGLPNRQCFRASGAVLVGTKGTCNSVRSGDCDRRFAKEANDPAGFGDSKVQSAHNPKVGGSNPPPATKFNLHKDKHLDRISSGPRSIRLLPVRSRWWEATPQGQFY